jgi:hypothetical protein
MPGLIIGGRIVDVPGVLVVNYLDDPRLRLSERLRRPRSGDARGAILHSESGDDPHVVLELDAPADPNHGAHLVAADEADAHAGTPHSQHLILGGDTTVFQCADLATEVTYHARQANEWTVGIEIEDRAVLLPDPFGLKPYPTGQARAFRRPQLCALVRLMDVITRELGIQRQVQRVYRGPIDRLAGGRVRGIYGHRDQTDERGPGDPGDAPIAMLLEAGYEGVNYGKREDEARWSERQRGLGVADDGDPGPQTCAAIKRSGRPRGMWIPRPGD